MAGAEQRSAACWNCDSANRRASLYASQPALDKNWFACHSSGYRLYSLRDMLQLFVDQIHRFSATLMKFFLLPDLAYAQQNMDELAGCLEAISGTCSSLGLRLSKNQADLVLRQIQSRECTPDLLHKGLEQLHTRIYEELQGELFLHIARDKADFSMLGYWDDSEIDAAFPSVAIEFVRAGHCFAYDESTACVFHLMRIVNAGLKATARSLGVVYDSRNWHSIGQEIQRRMEQKYQNKTEEWRKAEPLYASVLTDIQAISKGHRNDVIHQIEKTYDDKEAYELIIITRGFIRHLAKGGIHE